MNSLILAGSNVRCRTDFVVVNGNGGTLLGRETAELLSLLRVGPSQANSVTSGQLESDIRERYKELFTGAGFLRDYELKLHIDESVKPVAQHVRRIPFGLREKVDKKLDELLELDIIEEVPEGPSGWISLLVVVPKGDGDVRVCVDMRRANEAIIRERHPIPTVEELLHDLNSSTVFSKIDLKWGFHQILLSEADVWGDLGAAKIGSGSSRPFQVKGCSLVIEFQLVTFFLVRKGTLPSKGLLLEIGLHSAAFSLTTEESKVILFSYQSTSRFLKSVYQTFPLGMRRCQDSPLGVFSPPPAASWSGW